MQQQIPTAATRVAPPQGLRGSAQRLVEPGGMAGALLLQFGLQLLGTPLRSRRQLIGESRVEAPLELPLAGASLTAQAKRAAAAAAGEQHRYPAAVGLASLHRRGPQVLAACAQQDVDLRHSLGQPQPRPGADIGHGHHQIRLTPRLLENR
ncbi:hypothetical protein D3C80_1656290 [compost metagenome]